MAAKSNPTRQRTMTSETMSSMGSFATYMSSEQAGANDGNKFIMEEQQIMPTNPVVSDMDDEEVPLEQQVQAAQYRATDALDALRQLSEGIRIITRQMKHAHDDVQEEEQLHVPPDGDTEIQRERSWSDSCSTIQSCASDDDRRLGLILQQLEGTLGADLMSLAHAAQMVGENSRLASHEASQSVRDVCEAQQSIAQAEKRTAKAESAVRIMYKKQKELIGQLEQTKKERNVLKRQVKALLQEKSVLKEQEHVARALELHVVSALQAHEKQLALQQAKRQEEMKNDDFGNVATVRLDCAIHHDDECVDEKVVEPEVHEGYFAAESKDTKDSKDATDKDKFVDVVAENTVKQPPTKQVPVKEKSSSGGLGHGLTSVIGFVGGIGSRPPTKKEKAKGLDSKRPTVEKKVDKVPEKNVATMHDEQEQEPTLISPTNSVDDPVAEGSTESTACISGAAADEPETSSSTAETSIATDGISPCNQASLISPSPTENSTVHRKGFFRRSNKGHCTSNKEHRPSKERRTSKAAVPLKKPLLQLDDSSVDFTEGSQDYTFTSETAPISDTTSSTSNVTCDVHVDHALPTSLSCSTADQVSPFPHDYATGTATSVLDDKAFRSLAVPSFVAPSPRIGHVDDRIAPESPTCPPELSEIAAIYAEIGQLHEC